MDAPATTNQAVKMAIEDLLVIVGSTFSEEKLIYTSTSIEKRVKK